MTQFSVCAIVVTFHPDPDVLENLALLRKQFQRVLVVDNGSLPHTLGPLRRAADQHDYLVVENGVNLGIAAALNRGARQAAKEGYEWVALFDQDSVVAPGFMDAMFKGMEESSLPTKPAIYVPRYFDRGSGEEMQPVKEPGGELLVARTSGCLIPLWVFDECGWFIEELVIDQVDYEFCLRVRAKGYRIVQCAQAMLRHSLGAPMVHRVLGMRLFGTTNHNPARRYYLARNRTWLLKKYWASYPTWCSGLCILTLKEIVKILLVENRRWSKLGHTLLGLYDGVIGRMGMTVKL
ncbi:MAG TPA: glycosyltransferase family 2 protein [Acidisarcina sp.]